MSTRARADAFARVLDEDGGAQDPVVQVLVRARTELSARTDPDPAFRDALRTRVLAVAAVQQPGSATATPPRPTRRWLRPLATAVAGVVVAAGALVGVSVASVDALPGDLLYGAKRATESLELRRADGPLNEGIARLHLAEDRLAEVRALAGRGGGTALGGGPGVVAAGADAARIRATLRDMDELTRTGSDLVEQVVVATGDLTPLSLLVQWSVQQAQRLLDVAKVLPRDARDRLGASLTLVGDLNRRTTDQLD